MALKTDYKDDILASSMNGKRRYRQTSNSDGSISLEDYTIYEQEGDNFGAAQFNAVCKEVNNLDDKKVSKRILGVSAKETLTGEFLNDKPIYTKMIEVGALPNNTTKTVPTGLSNLEYYWIDVSNSFCFSGGAFYPIPHVEPKTIANSIGVRLTGYGANLVVSTGANWSSYAGIVTVKYTKK